MSISELGAAEAVASRILDAASSLAEPGKTISDESILRDIGLGVRNAVLLMIDVEGKYQINLKQFLPKHDTMDELLSLRLQDVIDATIKALAENPVAGISSIPVEAIKPELQVVQALAAPKLTPAYIEAVIASEHYFTASQGLVGNVEADATDAELSALDHVTFCVLLLRNGAKVTGVNHGPVSAANFDAEDGRKRARANAIEKVWELEGYLLRSRLANPAEDGEASA